MWTGLQPSYWSTHPTTSAATYFCTDMYTSEKHWWSFTAEQLHQATAQTQSDLWGSWYLSLSCRPVEAPTRRQLSSLSVPLTSWYVSRLIISPTARWKLVTVAPFPSYSHGTKRSHISITAPSGAISSSVNDSPHFPPPLSCEVTPVFILYFLHMDSQQEKVQQQ